MNEPKPGAQDAPKKSSRGCFYCCLSSFLIVLVLGAVGGFAAYRFITGTVAKYTSETPAEIPIVEYSEEQVEEIQARIESFKEGVEEGAQQDELILTADEINALIAKDDDLKGRVYITIADDKVAGDVSIPTDAIPGGAGRYFNASASFNVMLENGVLIVTLASAKVGDELVPAEIVEAMGKENLAKDIYKNPEVAELISKFESLTVQEDVIILKPRQVAGDVGQEAGETAEMTESTESAETDAGETTEVAP